jgi:hypothetical protein
MLTQNHLSAAVRAALNSFESTLKPADLVDMKISSLDDVHDAMLKIQKKQGAEKKLLNLNRMQVFLDGMEQYEELVEVLLNVPVMVVFIWASLALRRTTCRKITP